MLAAHGQRRRLAIAGDAGDRRRLRKKENRLNEVEIPDSLDQFLSAELTFCLSPQMYSLCELKIVDEMQKVLPPSALRRDLSGL
jgi:hypothetical protein